LDPTTPVISCSNIACITAIPAATLSASSPSRAAPAMSPSTAASSSGNSGVPGAVSGASTRRRAGTFFFAVVPHLG
jgi:hypothetical protein